MFEVIFITAMPDVPKADLLAALLIFRLFYLLIPFAMAIVVVLLFERSRLSNAWRDRLPYIVALVEFPDAPGVRLIANVAADPETLAIGMAVKPRFDDGAAIGKGGVTFVPAGSV